MKKILLFSVLLSLFGCPGMGSSGEDLNNPPSEELEKNSCQPSDNNDFSEQSKTNSDNVQATPGSGRYVLKVRLKQSRMSLDPFKHLADAANAEEFEIFTDQQAYNEAVIGMALFTAFRSGSFFVHGSWSDWELTVIDKRIIKE